MKVDMRTEQASSGAAMMYDSWDHMRGFGFGFGPISMLLVAVLVVLPFWRLFEKAGFSGWLALLMLVPLVNVLALYFLAFTDWPAQKK